MRRVDALAVERYGIPSLKLMENAGKRCMLSIAGHGPNPYSSHYVVLCGPGNNGGDGFVIARHLHENKISVEIVLSHPVDRSVGDAKINLERCIDLKIKMQTDLELDPQKTNVIIDALLGTGATESPRGRVAELIARMRQLNLSEDDKVYAIDVPSGLDADTGTPFDPSLCIPAFDTLTLAGLKLGFLNPASRPWTGLVRLIDLDIPYELLEEIGTYHG